MRYAIIWGVLLSLCGCTRPFQVRTDNDVRLAGRVATDVRVKTELPPVKSVGRLSPVTVEGHPPPPGPRVALLDVDGLLLNANFVGLSSRGENPVALFREKLKAASRDPQVRAMVLRINSPGGTVAATDIMWKELQDFKAKSKLPVVACLMDVGCGGAYYLASACDRIVAHPATLTGGVGVVMNLYNLKEVMNFFNIRPQSVKAGPNIVMGNHDEFLIPEARKLLQAMADEYHHRFIKVVRAGRPGIVDVDKRDAPKREDEEGEPSVFDGRIFTASQALERGLIDHVGYLDRAITEAASLAGCGPVSVVFYRRPGDPVRSIYEVTANSPLTAGGLVPRVPGLDRSRLPLFLYLWQPDPTLLPSSGAKTAY